MNVSIAWPEIALRLFCTVLGGIVIGLNREEHGRAAGLRTTLLVALAASVSMIQMNLLLPTAGKMPGSFVVMDVMRLPLGILSGMGFIGAGAILRRDNVVLGVTTAATLWFVTVMGLCFGGGQILLGLVTLVLGMFALVSLKRLEMIWKQKLSAILNIVSGPIPADEQQLIQAFIDAGYKVRCVSAVYGESGCLREFQCKIYWHARPAQTDPPDILKQFVRRFNLQRMDWRIESF